MEDKINFIMLVNGQEKKTFEQSRKSSCDVSLNKIDKWAKQHGYTKFNYSEIKFPTWENEKGELVEVKARPISL